MSVAGGGNATSVNHNNTLNNEYLYIVIALRRVTDSCLPSSISNNNNYNYRCVYLLHCLHNNGT